MVIHESGEDYLEAIYILKLMRSGVHAIDVANELNFSKPSVTRALKILKANGYIIIDDENHISFTEKGLEKAKDVYDRHQTLLQFLKLLGVSDETAEKDACRIEHDISVETFECVKAFVLKSGAVAEK
ncbi:MAG: metal-dependent transcriptional regulator [Christensenellaceae bacterium]|jgi:Mn-dependent DtxR family transcriptional regulator|nr:metal-dependent transcriptional regulator [Christensenellaceae bacterium]